MLARHLGARPASEGAHRAAQACLFRFNTRLSARYRTFGWALLPASFGISGKAANGRFVHWTRTGEWFSFWDELVPLRFGPAQPDPPDLAALAQGTPLDALVLELTRAYRYFNRRFFGGELPATAVLTLEPPRRGAKGYFRPYFWQLPDQPLHHVAVLATTGRLGVHTAMQTLLHEMAHLRNASCGIQDTNPGTQYHTQDFRDVARLLGLECGERHVSYGYFETRLGPRALQAIATLQPVSTVFELEFK